MSASAPPPRFRLRDARASDVPALVALESRFPTDRMPARQFRHHALAGDGRLRVATLDGEIAGYALTLVRRGAGVARLYSIAVDPDRRGYGLGARLLADAERGARRRGCDRLRLEVRVRNRRAIALYESRGYVRFARREGYYEDGSDAFRYEKRLRRPRRPGGDRR